MKRRLYLQIYFGVVVVALAFTLVAALIAQHFWLSGERSPRFLERAAEQIVAQVEDSDGTREELAETLRRRARAIGVNATLFEADGTPIASTRRRRPDAPPRGFLREAREDREDGGDRADRGDREARIPRIPGLTLELADGRWLRVRPDRHRRSPRAGPIGSSLLLLLAIGAGAYPVSRRITRRLERLQRGVEHLGEGQLGARVEVEGEDEVAQLAQSFNSAAERIEILVETQRRLMASASHELRTPLARLRVAIELLAQEPRESLRLEAERDIAELDELIEDLLLSARLQAGGAPHSEPVPLLPIVREEAMHVGADVEGEEVSLRGDARALRRLVRNLLENAARYGEPPIRVALGRETHARGDAVAVDRVVLTVRDAGRGVPEAERERIFEPFYRPRDHSEERHGGVGLGLALVREIARQHGGEARCLPADASGDGEAGSAAEGDGSGATVFEVTLGAVLDASEGQAAPRLPFGIA